jgi:hypothetical protein
MQRIRTPALAQYSGKRLFRLYGGPTQPVAGRHMNHAPETQIVIDWIFLLITGFIAYHALTHRNEDGENDVGHLLFGAIALLFFMRVLIVDIFKLM